MNTTSSRIPGARLHERFVARAQNLLEDRQFRARVSTVREGWDREYPPLAVGSPIFPTVEQLERSMSLWFEYRPPRMLKIMKCLNFRDFSRRGYRQEQLRTFGMQGCDCGCLWSWPELIRAEADWESRIESLCFEWWPPEYFPVVSPFRHPARNFVAACLLWRFEVVPASLIQQPDLRPRRMPDDQLLYWYEMANGLFEHIEQRVKDGGQIDQTDLTAIVDEVHEVAFSRFVRLYEPSDPFRTLNQTFENEYEHFLDTVWSMGPDASLRHLWKPLYVPIYPGMKTTDWRALEHIVMAEMEDQLGSEPIAHWIDVLSQRGLSDRAISRLLGVHRKTVATVRANLIAPDGEDCA